MSIAIISNYKTLTSYPQPAQFQSEMGVQFQIGITCSISSEYSINDDDENIKGFAKGILNDFQAIYQGFISSWSNGPVEGQVNRLKNIKRQMYGRASFELLRKRVVITSQS